MLSLTSFAAVSVVGAPRGSFAPADRWRASFMRNDSPSVTTTIP